MVPEKVFFTWCLFIKPQSILSGICPINTKKSILGVTSFEELSTPCSDGKDFESMAPRLYDCVQSYFQAEIGVGLFAYYKELEYSTDEDEDSYPELELLNHRITDLFLEHRMLELYRLYPHPRFKNRIKFLELTTSGKPLSDDEWVEAELLWVDFCQRRGREVTPLDRQKIIDSWDKE